MGIQESIYKYGGDYSTSWPRSGTFRLWVVSVTHSRMWYVVFLPLQGLVTQTDHFIIDAVDNGDLEKLTNFSSEFLRHRSLDRPFIFLMFLLLLKLQLWFVLRTCSWLNLIQICRHWADFAHHLNNGRKGDK